jgi:hypothetical protein
MPEIISCPDCERKLRVPDHLLGKKVKCPGCGTMFTGKAAGARGEDTPKTKARSAARDERIEEKPRAGRRSVVPPPLEADEDDRPRRRRRPEDEYDEDDRPRARRREEEEDRDDDYPRSLRGSAYEDEDEGDEPGTTPRSVVQGWRKVRSGINLVVLGGWIQFGAYIILLIAGVIGLIIMVAGASAVVTSVSTAPARGPIGQPPAFTPPPSPSPGGISAMLGGGLMICFVGGLVGLAGIAEVVMRLTGYGFCMGVVPPRGKDTSLKTLAITAFSLAAGAVALYAINLLLNMVGVRNSILSLLAFPLHIASFVVFMIFVRGVCLRTGQKEMAGKVVTNLIAWGVYYVGIVLSSCLIGIALGAAMFGALSGGGGGGPTPGSVASSFGTFAIVACALLGLILVVGACLFVWYLMILGQVRNGLDRHLRRS